MNLFLKSNNSLQSGKSTLTYRKQNSTNYRKNKDVKTYLKDKLEKQITDLYKKEVSLISNYSIDEDIYYYFYNLKNKLKISKISIHLISLIYQMLKEIY